MKDKRFFSTCWQTNENYLAGLLQPNAGDPTVDPRAGPGPSGLRRHDAVGRTSASQAGDSK